MAKKEAKDNVQVFDGFELVDKSSMTKAGIVYTYTAHRFVKDGLGGMVYAYRLRDAGNGQFVGRVECCDSFTLSDATAVLVRSYKRTLKESENGTQLTLPLGTPDTLKDS